MNYDDSDMKIVRPGQSDSPAADGDGDDIDRTAALLRRERLNGNLSRVRRLGAILAEEVSSEVSSGAGPGGDNTLQDRILLAFTAETGMSTLLPNHLLTQTAHSVFYSTLRQTAPEFLEALQDSGAFSFYRLCFNPRRGAWDSGEARAKIGETYASLCGNAGDASLIKRGTRVYGDFILRMVEFTAAMELAAAEPEPE